jgi:hypothetical protein
MSEHDRVMSEPNGRKAMPDLDEMARSTPLRIDRNDPAPLVRAPDAVLALQAGIGNQAVQRMLAVASRAQRCDCDGHGRLRVEAGPRVGGRALQRMAFAVGDLAELAHKGQKLSADDQKEAEIITKAVKARVEHTHEKQVNPWDERLRPFYRGPLASIGNEELRIYGHGGSYATDDFVSQIGGYTAPALAKKLIEMGLPEAYSGEIYLTGCNTAKGDDLGFLGKFYAIIVKDCPRVRVRGNVAISTTFEDGTQGVWTGVFPSESDFKKLTQTMGEEADRIPAELEAAIADARKETDVNIRQTKIDDVTKLRDKGAERMAALAAQKERLKRTAYSSDPSFTRVLPK